MKLLKPFQLYESNAIDYKIRLAKAEDYPTIKKISNQNREWLPFVMRVAIQEAINRQEVLVAEYRDVVIAFMHFHKRKDGITTLHEIATDKNFRKLGIAKLLISQLERPIRLKVVQDNPANQFYQRLGFRLTGTIAGKKKQLNCYQLF